MTTRGDRRDAPVVIIGAGFGGLAAAVALSLRGERVVVIEAGAAPGGKSRVVDVGGTAIAVGPTVLTMPWAFDELLAPIGKKLADLVALDASDLLARHAWPDGSRLDLFTDLDRSADAIAAFAGPVEAAAYRRYAAYSEAIANVVREPFLRAPKPTMGAMLAQVFGKKDGTPALGLSALATLDAHRTMGKAIASYFRDPRLQQLFGRYATYVGSSATHAPATFNLIAHVEREGVFRVDGGVPALARALANVAENAGCVFRYGARVCRVVTEDGRVSGVQVDTADGSQILAARAVLANADVASLASGHLGSEAAAAVGAQKSVARDKRSLSAMTFAIAARVTGFPLAHHTVFFGRTGGDETAAIFKTREIPPDPTIYICAEDRGRDETYRAAKDVERLFVVVNAPADGDRDATDAERAAEVDRCRKSVLDRMARAGLHLDIKAMDVTTPRMYERAAPGTGGALYGDAAHGPFSALSRAESRTKLPGLYLAGGSVHPGPGAPMATLSGMLAARAILHDLPSTAQSHATATAGFTSTE